MGNVDRDSAVQIKAQEQIHLNPGRDTYRYAQQLWVYRHSERQGLWILSVERFECGHQGLTKLLWLEDWEEIRSERRRG